MIYNCPTCGDIELQEKYKITTERLFLKTHYFLVFDFYCPICKQIQWTRRYYILHNPKRPIKSIDGKTYMVFDPDKEDIKDWANTLNPKTSDVQKYVAQEELSFEEVCDRIKKDTEGTLIVISGQTGCGKTTLALKLMTYFNGCADADALVSSSKDMGEIPSDGYRSYLIDDVFRTIYDEIYSKIYYNIFAKNRIMIIVTQNRHNLPKYLEENVKNRCYVSFKEKGSFGISGCTQSSDGTVHPYRSVG